MIRMIAAMSLDRVIGVYKGHRCYLPWRRDEFPGDLKRFRELTDDGVVVMGNKTFLSMRRKPLPNRLNIVITRSVEKPKILQKDDVRGHGLVLAPGDLDSAVFKAGEDDYLDFWVIGGRQIFQLFFPVAHEIDLTIMPIKVFNKKVKQHLVYFPEVDEENWEKVGVSQHPYNDRLRTIKYRRKQ